MMKAVIAGGGLAGLACAKRLVDAGLQVELVEAGPQFGGRATSWRDSTDGQTVEAGLHSFFGIYSRLIALLQEVGVDLDEMVRWDEAVAFLQPGPRYYTFGINPVRALPRTLVGVVGNNRFLRPRDKLRLAQALVQGLARRRAYAYETLSTLARRAHVSNRAHERLLRPMSRGLLFLEPEEVAAYAPLLLIKHMLTSPASIRAGTFRGGMGEVMIAPLVRWLTSHGAILRTGARVKAIWHAEGDPKQVTGFQLEDGEMLTGDVYVSALPLEVLQPMVPPTWASFPYFANVQAIRTVPATAVQLWFDYRFVLRREFTFVADSPMIIFQDQSYTTFPYQGSRISCQITDRDTDGYTDQQYIDLALAELYRRLPAATGAQLQKAVVVRHRAFAMETGARDRRPAQVSPIPGFYVAGDYTQQDWFTTMEGAMRSGEYAAREILKGREGGAVSECGP